jgi:hypothetical protein
LLTVKRIKDMTKIKELQNKLHSLRTSEAEINSEIKELRANKTIKCLCGKYHKIKDMDIIIPQRWHRGYSYEDGYNEDVGLFAVCAKNPELANRLLFDDYSIDYYKRDVYKYNAKMQFATLYQHLFKSIVRIDEDKVPYKRWGNNEYIDKNHKKFEIKIGETK